MKVAIIIPARYSSSRLPGKPLADIGGRPMIQHVYERAVAAGVGTVLVATDDQRIMAAVTGFGGVAVMTSATHQSGTDRCAEAARNLEAEVVVNLQGDEPLLHPDMITQVVAPLLAANAPPLATLATLLSNSTAAFSPNVVKVVRDLAGCALYFSRRPIPAWRDVGDTSDAPLPQAMLKHIGIYAFQARALQQFTALQPTPLEQLERLEQLRALEHGWKIKVEITPWQVQGVDTQEDLDLVRRTITGEEGEVESTDPSITDSDI